MKPIIKVKFETYRSRPNVSMSDDYAKLTITGPKWKVRRIKKMVESGITYADPNVYLGTKMWWHLSATKDEIEQAECEGKFALDEWVNGSPGTDKNYIRVTRYIEIVDGNAKLKIIIGVSGNLCITQDQVEIIRRQFMGAHYEPEATPVNPDQT